MMKNPLTLLAIALLALLAWPRKTVAKLENPLPEGYPEDRGYEEWIPPEVNDGWSQPTESVGEAPPWEFDWDWVRETYEGGHGAGEIPVGYAPGTLAT